MRSSTQEALPKICGVDVTIIEVHGHNNIDHLLCLIVLKVKASGSPNTL